MQVGFQLFRNVFYRHYHGWVDACHGRLATVSMFLWALTPLSVYNHLTFPLQGSENIWRTWISRLSLKLVIYYRARILIGTLLRTFALRVNGRLLGIVTRGVWNLVGSGSILCLILLSGIIIDQMVRCLPSLFMTVLFHHYLP